jgi:hypothetical protein
MCLLLPFYYWAQGCATPNPQYSHHVVVTISKFQCTQLYNSYVICGPKSNIPNQVQSTVASNERRRYLCALLEPRMSKQNSNKNPSSDANSVPYAQSYLYPIHSPWANSSSPVQHRLSPPYFTSNDIISHSNHARLKTRDLEITSIVERCRHRFVPHLFDTFLLYSWLPLSPSTQPKP